MPNDNLDDIVAHLEAALLLIHSRRVEIPENASFKDLLREAGLTIMAFCKLSGTPYSTAKTWASKSCRTSPMASSWLLLFRFACARASRAEVEALLLDLHVAK